MKRAICFGFVALWLAPEIWAQSPVLAPPAPPYLKAPPQMSAWIVQMQGSEDGRQVNVIRTKNLRLVVITHADGQRDELWSNGMCLVENTPAGPGVAGQIKSPQSLLEAYQLSDFPEFNWVSKQNFAGRVEFENRPCLVFRSNQAKGHYSHPKGEPGTLDSERNPAPKPESKQQVTAWIDAETRRPVQWMREKEVRKVLFTPPPSETLKIPDQIAAIFEQMKRLKEITTTKAPRGG